jgi:uroporphyrinogen-III decarboxylase
MLSSNTNMTGQDRFLGVMDYKPVDRIPNFEAGVWDQTKARWIDEGLNEFDLHWDWFTGEEYFAMDAREFINVKTGMMPEFAQEVIEKSERYEIKRHANGVVTKALIEGTMGNMRSSMDQYVSFPVSNIDDFHELKKRFDPSLESRYPAQWKEILLPRWKNRRHVLSLPTNGNAMGFYCLARQWMGTEGTAFAWSDHPALMHEIMEFGAEFAIEVFKPILEQTDIDYYLIGDDMAMKNGPMMSPEQFKSFIYSHMKKLIDFLKGHGVKYVAVDTDGNCEKLIPILLDAGVDALWPVERAAGMDPLELRRKFGKDLRLWGGVDKMEIAKGKEAIDKHLGELVPLAEEGGFIPTVDHLVSPDISLENFRYYMKRKIDLLSGRF